MTMPYLALCVGEMAVDLLGQKLAYLAIRGGLKFVVLLNVRMHSDSMVESRRLSDGSRLVRPNGLELCCPAARASLDTFSHSSAGQQP